MSGRPLFPKPCLYSVLGFHWGLGKVSEVVAPGWHRGLRRSGWILAQSWVGRRKGIVQGSSVLRSYGELEGLSRVAMHPILRSGCRPPRTPTAWHPSCFECAPYIDGSKRIVRYQAVGLHWWSTIMESFRSSEAFSTIARCLTDSERRWLPGFAGPHQTA